VLADMLADLLDCPVHIPRINDRHDSL
jgi:hypothetical protein